MSGSVLSTGMHGAKYDFENEGMRCETLSRADETADEMTVQSVGKQPK